MRKTKSPIKQLRHDFMWHWTGIARYGYLNWIATTAGDFQAQAMDFIALQLVSELIRQKPEATRLATRAAWYEAEKLLPLAPLQIVYYGTQQMPPWLERRVEKDKFAGLLLPPKIRL